MDEEHKSDYNQSYDNNYALTGKLMLVSVIVFFVFGIIIAAIHLYARWFFLQRSQNNQNLRRRRRFSFASTNPSSSTQNELAPSVLKSIPLFLYSARHHEVHDTPLECTVCLSEFQENETGRILPKCNHAFHLECIDMWFVSHSNCPLCRAPVQLSQNHGHQTGNPPEMIVTVAEPDVPESSSSGQSNEHQMGCSSSCSNLPQLVTVAVDIPAATDGVNIQSEGGPRLKPTGDQVRSLKRFLSI